MLFLSTFSMGLAVSAKKECSSQVFLHFSSDFAYIGPLWRIRGKVDQNSPVGLPAEKKVTEGPSRVGIVSKSWGTRTRPDLPHRVWVAEGWSSAPAWVSAVEAQTGLAARLLVKREPQYRPPERTTQRSFCQTADSSQKEDAQPPTKDVGLRRLSRRSIADTSLRCYPSPWGGSPMWVTL